MSSDIPIGNLKPNSNWGEANQMAFFVQQTLAKVQTVTLVKVEACTNNGGLSPVGFVDVTPLVNQIDGEGNPMPHETIYNVPYMRLQGGTNAIICDPVVGDIGLCGFASRDISKVKATKKKANPGSRRQFSYSDGLYIGGMLNGTPSQWIQFNSSGIKIHSPVAVILDAPDVTVNAGNSATVNAPTISIVASTVAKITSASIEIGASGQTLVSFVTSLFKDLFNGHDHPTPSGTSSAPNQKMTDAHLTSTIKGG